ncbi:MAG: hypothetical protein H6766_03300 [Candidatus Peribacteria bacterium]|nr:MAG: hypothetical protein H6766_03300 [Candidatus Peribacteria bacterium]
MSSLQRVTHYVIGFLVLIAASFVLQARVTYGLDLARTKRMRIFGREVLRFGLLVRLAFSYPKALIRRAHERKRLLLALLVLVVW